MAQKSGGFWSEFRNFAVKGNALELAIAVVVGNAFGAIVNSLVADIITPLIALLTGNVDLKHFSYSISPNAVVQYGAFIQTIINFFIISLSIFVVFKLLASARERLFRRGEDAVPEHEKPAQERLLEEIRDLLKERQ